MEKTRKQYQSHHNQFVLTANKLLTTIQKEIKDTSSAWMNSREVYMPKVDIVYMTTLLQLTQPAVFNHQQLHEVSLEKGELPAGFLLEYKPVQTSGDGACFYNAVSLCLFGNEEYTNVVKVAVLDFVLRNETAVENYLKKAYSESTYEDFVSRIATKTEWADQDIIFITSAVLQRPIQMFFEFGNSYSGSSSDELVECFERRDPKLNQHLRFNLMEEFSEKQPVYIHHVPLTSKGNRNHFVALLPTTRYALKYKCFSSYATNIKWVSVPDIAQHIPTIESPQSMHINKKHIRDVVILEPQKSDLNIVGDTLVESDAVKDDGQHPAVVLVETSAAENDNGTLLFGHTEETSGVSSKNLGNAVIDFRHNVSAEKIAVHPCASAGQIIKRASALLKALNRMNKIDGMIAVKQFVSYDSNQKAIELMNNLLETTIAVQYNHQVINKPSCAPNELPKGLRKHYTPVETTGNGACLYNAVSICLCGNEKLTHVIKVATASFVIKNDEYFSNFLKESRSGTTFEEFATKVISKHAWSNDYTLYAMSGVLRRPIYVYRGFGDPYKLKSSRELDSCFRSKDAGLYNHKSYNIFPQCRDETPVRIHYVGFNVTDHRNHFVAMLPTSRTPRCFNCFYEFAGICNVSTQISSFLRNIERDEEECVIVGVDLPFSSLQVQGQLLPTSPSEDAHELPVDTTNETCSNYQDDTLKPQELRGSIELNFAAPHSVTFKTPILTLQQRIHTAGLCLCPSKKQLLHRSCNADKLVNILRAGRVLAEELSLYPSVGTGWWYIADQLFTNQKSQTYCRNRAKKMFNRYNGRADIKDAIEKFLGVGKAQQRMNASSTNENEELIYEEVEEIGNYYSVVHSQNTEIVYEKTSVLGKQCAAESTRNLSDMQQRSIQNEVTALTGSNKVDEESITSTYTITFTAGDLQTLWDSDTATFSDTKNISSVFQPRLQALHPGVRLSRTHAPRYNTTNVSDTIARVYFRCSFEGEGCKCESRFVVNVHRAPNNREAPTFKVIEMGRYNHTLEKGFDKVTYRLTGSARKEAAEKLVYMTPLRVRMDIGNQKQPQFPEENSRTPGIGVLKTLKYQNRQKDRLKGDGYTTIKARQMELSERHGFTYIQNVTKEPFHFSLYSPVTMSAVVEVITSQRGIACHADCTGSVFSKRELTEKKPLYLYSLITSGPRKDLSEHALILPVWDFVTNCHKASHLNNCFNQVQEELEHFSAHRGYTNQPLIKRVTTDFSYALMTAVVGSFNKNRKVCSDTASTVTSPRHLPNRNVQCGMTLKQYIVEMNKLSSGEETRESTPISCINTLCRSHLIKSMSRLLKKHFPDDKLFKTHRQLGLHAFASLTVCPTREQFLNVFKDFVYVFEETVETEGIERIRKELSAQCNYTAEMDSDYAIDVSDFTNIFEDGKYQLNSMQEICAFNRTLIKIRHEVQNCILRHRRLAITNRTHNKDLVDVFMTVYAPVVTFWGDFFIKSFEDTMTINTNGLIEKYYQTLKHNVLSNQRVTFTEFANEWNKLSNDYVQTYRDLRYHVTNRRIKNRNMTSDEIEESGSNQGDDSALVDMYRDEPEEVWQKKKQRKSKYGVSRQLFSNQNDARHWQKFPDTEGSKMHSDREQRMNPSIAEHESINPDNRVASVITGINGLFRQPLRNTTLQSSNRDVVQQHSEDTCYELPAPKLYRKDRILATGCTVLEKNYIDDVIGMNWKNKLQPNDNIQINKCRDLGTLPKESVTVQLNEMRESQEPMCVQSSKELPLRPTNSVLQAKSKAVQKKRNDGSKNKTKVRRSVQGDRNPERMNYETSTISELGQTQKLKPTCLAGNFHNAIKQCSKIFNTFASYYFQSTPDQRKVSAEKYNQLTIPGGIQQFTVAQNNAALKAFTQCWDHLPHGIKTNPSSFLESCRLQHVFQAMLQAEIVNISIQ